MNNPLLEAVSKGLILNEKNEALVLTVGEYKDRPDKSFQPDLPGGLIDPGETELLAVAREIVEETGITINLDQLTLVYTKTEFYEEENKSTSKFLYLARLDYTPEVTVSWEHANFAWHSLEQLKSEVKLRPFYREAVDYCFTHGLL